MRLVLYLLIFTAIQVSASDAIAQKINYSGQHVAVKEVLSAIEKQTGYLFFYDVTLLNKAKSVTVNLDDVTVEDALDKICASQNFSWVAEKKTITLIAKPTPELPEKSYVELQEDPLLQTVSGKVSDKEGKPLAGATVLIKGTSSGVLSDNEGNFNLKAKPNDVLKISFVGYKSTEVNLAGKASYKVMLETELMDLDEVQVIAYGTTTKRLSTSAISSIKADIIEKQAVINPLQALQGRVAGLSLVQNSGAIGSGMEIQIRGVNSIESGTQPLIIIDGTIVPSQGLVSSPTDSRSTTFVGGYMLASMGTTSFNSINPEDVESIEVLKDADATAIYGSRGANGVIMITTKKAKLGDTRFSVDASQGINMATYIQPRMSLSQYLEMRKDAFAT